MTTRIKGYPFDRRQLPLQPYVRGKKRSGAHERRPGRSGPLQLIARSEVRSPTTVRTRESPFPDRVRRTRRKAGLTQQDLALQVGVNRSAVAQWERPDGSRPSMQHLAGIALATQVPLDWLGTGRGDPSSEDGACDVSAQPLPDSIDRELFELISRLSQPLKLALADFVRTTMTAAPSTKIARPSKRSG